MLVPLLLAVALDVGVSVGDQAPDFKLSSARGKSVSLSDYAGKTVVLEWFNPECPFVRASHERGSLKGLAKKQQAEGVVWLAINSGAKGKQGSGKEKNLASAKRFALGHPILLDESGTVGRQYGATNTPQLFVITPRGKIAYMGAIDNSPDGAQGMPTDGKLVNYVDAALDAVARGKQPKISQTKPYGCSVKYAN